jgi:hypothetical protein
VVGARRRRGNAHKPNNMGAEVTSNNTDISPLCRDRPRLVPEGGSVRRDQAGESRPARKLREAMAAASISFPWTATVRCECEKAVVRSGIAE